MVNNEGISVEDDSSVEDDDDDSEHPAARRAPRHVPLSGVAEKKEAETEKPRAARLSGQLIEKMGAKKDTPKEPRFEEILGKKAKKSEKPILELDEKEKSEAAHLELIDPSPHSVIETDKAQTDAVLDDISLESDIKKHHKSKKTETEPEKPLPEGAVEIPVPEPENLEPDALKEATAETLEATSWENEGDLEEEGEINLAPPAAVTPEAAVPKAETEEAPAPEEEPAPGPVFVERPLEPMDTGEEPAAETGPVDDELLESGLESEEPATPPGEGPPPPPELPADGLGEDEPDEPYDPVVVTRPFSYGGGGGGGPWYNAAAAENSASNVKDKDDSEYYAEKRGLRKGLGAGLLFGWLAGRHGKKKAAREHAKELNAKDREIKDIKEKQLVDETQLRGAISAMENHKAKIAELGAKQSAEAANRLERVSPISGTPTTAELSKAVVTEKLAEATPEEAKAPKAEKQPIFVPLAPELFKSASVERVPFTSSETEQFKASPEMAKATTEQLKNIPVEERPITEETYAAPEGRRVETSAWHRIEIDEKTGNPVENPEIEYGAEFQRERSREIKREDAQLGAAAAASSTLGSLAMNDVIQAGSPVGAGQAGSNGAAIPETHKTANPHHKQLTAGSELLRYTTMPLMWIIAVLIVVVLFTVGILR